MQSVLSSLVGRLSDVLDRKLFATIPPLIGCIGAVICAKATSISMLIGGGILIRTTLAVISIVQSIPSEILPLKHRALANGLAGISGAIGGMCVPSTSSPPTTSIVTNGPHSIGSLTVGAVTSLSAPG